MRKFTPGLAVLVSITLLHARQEQRSCASHDYKWREEIQLHQSSTAAQLKRKLTGGAKTALAARPDIGNIAHLEDGDGVVARRNAFNLANRTLRFRLSADGARYTYELGDASYDASQAEAGEILPLADDDSKLIDLGFAFPYFGAQHRSLFVNSDGNVTFQIGDAEITDRSLGRFLSGPPRIAPLFRDLDPTRARSGVKVLNEPARVVISWAEVPEYRDLGAGPLQTFQIRLFADGRIEIAYGEARTSDAVTGITPGMLKGDPSLISFLNTTGGVEYPAAVAERFSSSESVDIFAAAQKFYRNHGDAYDFLVIYNTLGIQAEESAVAYEVTVRNQRRGYGDVQVNVGDQAGSAKRLQAILNMGPLSQYPADPNGKVPARSSVGDTPLSTLAHEFGHLFLAYSSVVDENGLKPMLGHQSAHWDFKFNSDASLMEGNRIQDNGAGASPRFLTTATVEGFSALDQYLMGFRPANQVPDTFYVANATGAVPALPRVGVSFDGERRNVSISEILEVSGRRTPDHTVSQRRFRLAFLLVTPTGQSPTAEQLAQVETYRAQFEAYLAKVTSQNASVDTSVRKSMRVSSFPAIGVQQGRSAPVKVTVDDAPAAPLTLKIKTPAEASTSGAVVIPPGSREVSFDISGSAEGIGDLIIEPSDPSYETVFSKIQVSPASRLKLSVLSSSSPVKIKVTDLNDLPYPGLNVQARVTGGGTLDRQAITSDADGLAELRWTQQPGADNRLVASIADGPSVTIVGGARPAFAPSSVLNAASYAPGLVPGSIGAIFGQQLGGENAKILIDGLEATLLYGSDSQLNFLVPPDLAPGTAELTISSNGSVSAVADIRVLNQQPGVFSNPVSGFGVVTIANTGVLTSDRPAQAGDYLEVYATGLGGVRMAQSGLRETVARTTVTIGGVAAEVSYSGLTPGYTGLYQINVRVPAGLAAGAQNLVVTAGGVVSNSVKIVTR